MHSSPRQYTRAHSGRRKWAGGCTEPCCLSFQFRYEIFFKSLTALGQYNLYYFWSNYAGDFNITLEDVKAEGKGILEVSTNGTVQVS